MSTPDLQVVPPVAKTSTVSSIPVPSTTAPPTTAPPTTAPPTTAPPTTAPPTTSPSTSMQPLGPGELVAFTQFLAREIRAGAHVVDFDAQRRWHRRLYRDGRVDVWLISWLPEQGTQLHDHGGSAGAFTVVEGALAEAVLVRQSSAAASSAVARPAAGASVGGVGVGAAGAATLRERRHRTGATVGFDGRHVHDVRNLDRVPAVSVHAYSPPLTSMTFYDLERGRLTPFAQLDTDDPEIVPGGPGSAQGYERGVA